MTGTLLRIIVAESESHGKEPLFAAVVEELRAKGFSGATVLKGIAGFGVHRHVHSARAVDAASDLPIVIEVVETEERIRAVIPHLREMIPQGMLTLEKIEYIPVGEQRS